ncbi:2Fe-2S iron-sulfur cluster-binding protein [Streptomyces sp. NPDC088812]|uniref:2Fe-2S iron-sulfur cluster-binding protein n=1 Tax=Streptomyces sp. NPDC088812 TaxID=3365905 RepID=UPI0038275477
MTDDQHGQGTPQGGGRWDPLPQGDYDDGATAFVKLPEGGIDALLAGRGDSPLAAPGHGYVPPQFNAAHEGADPSATGAHAWTNPAGGTEWPAAATGGTAGDDRFTYHPGGTGQWTFDETTAPAAEPAPGHDVTGQWSIPVAGGDLPDESGEFTTSSLVEQWGGTPPATLPGGAPAPWATGPAPDAGNTPGQPWDRQPEGPAGQPSDVSAAPGAPGHAQPVADPSAFAPAPEHTAPPAPGPSYETPPYGSPSYETPAYEGDPYETAPYETAPYESPVPERDERDERTEWDQRDLGDEREAVEASQAASEPGEVPVDPHGAPGAAQGRETARTAHGAAHPTADPVGAEPVGAEPPFDGPGPAGAPEAPADADPAGAPHDGHEDAPGDEAAPGSEAAPHGDGAGAEDAAEAAPDAPPLHDDHPLASYALRVNGSDRPVTDAWIGESLLYVLRERLGLAGAKDGCSQGECGACNVQVDGRLVASCLVPAVTTAGSEIRTVEGLAVDGQPSDVQRALARCGAVQCGFCVPGMAMTVHDLLEGNPAPTELEARQALCGNLCRCSGYRGVLRAVQDVVAEREAHAAAEADTDGDEARIPHQAGPGAGGVNPSAFENPAQPHPNDPVYGHGQGQDGGQA